MGYYRLYQAVLCALSFYLSDSQVTVTTRSSQNNETSFVCGRSETLICTTVPSVSSMKWVIDSTQAANCFSTICSANPLFTPDYTFTFNVSAGKFYIMKHIVTLTDNGTTFTCQFGNVHDTAQVDVKVIDDYESNENKTIVDTSFPTTHVTYTATTGCLRTTTADKVKFEWFYKKVNFTELRKLYTNVSDEQSAGIKNESDCRSDPDCGVSGFTKKSSSLVITEDGDGETFVFEAVIYFGDIKRIVEFKTGIKLKVSTHLCRVCPADWPDECIACVSVSSAVFVSVLIFICLIYFDIGSSTKRYYFGIICGVAFICTCIILVVVCCKKGAKEEKDDSISDGCIAGSSEETCKSISKGCITCIALTVIDSIFIVMGISLLCYKRSKDKKA